MLHDLKVLIADPLVVAAISCAIVGYGMAIYILFSGSR